MKTNPYDIEFVYNELGCTKEQLEQVPIAGPSWFTAHPSRAISTTAEGGLQGQGGEVGLRLRVGRLEGDEEDLMV